MLFYKIARFLLRPLINLLFPTKVIGKENFPSKKAVLICNHYSVMDSVIIGGKLLKKGIFCVAKKEAFHNKFVAKLFIKFGAISVDRDAPGLKTHKQIMKVLNNDDILLMFPEGTRNKEGTYEMAPLKHGSGAYAIKGKAVVIPMIYHHKPKLFEKNYLIIGEAIHLDKFYDKPHSLVKEEVTELLTEKMNSLRQSLNFYVDNRKKRRIYCC